MFSTSYASGAGTAFFACKEDYNEYCSGTTRSDTKSIFALLAPYSSREYANPLDLTGAYGGNIVSLQEDPGQHHYATAPFYKAFWGWQTPSPDTPAKVHFDNGDCTPNTLVFQVKGGSPPFNPPVILRFYLFACVVCFLVWFFSRETDVVSFPFGFRRGIRACTTRPTACTTWSSRTPVTGATGCTRGAGRCARAWRNCWSPCTTRTCTAGVAI